MENNDDLPRKGTTRRKFLSASAVSAVAVPVISRTTRARASVIVPQPPSPDLRAMLSQVDPGRIQATIQRLVQFGTRHTGSSQTDPVRGIGAATAWVTQQMQDIAATSSGNMTVQQQSYVQSGV